MPKSIAGQRHPHFTSEYQLSLKVPTGAQGPLSKAKSPLILSEGGVLNEVKKWELIFSIGWRKDKHKRVAGFEQIKLWSNQLNKAELVLKLSMF